MEPPASIAKSDTEILIVEDSPTQAERLKHILELNQYRLATARNGRDALAALAVRVPALVISDVVMPEMDGFELCRQIKRDERFKDLPVILLTSLSDPVDVVNGLECGADNFIFKPYDEHYLLSRVAYLLANRNLRENEKTRMGIGVEVLFSGRKFFIRSDRLQILNLLLSTFEGAVERNRELTATRDELRQLNETLERKVEERTAELARSNAELTAEIAARQRSQSALSAAEAKFRTLVEQSLAGIYLIRGDRFIYVNPRMTEILGHGAEELAARPVLDFIAEPDRPLVAENIRKRLQGEVPSIHYQLRMVRQGGAVIHVEAHGARIEFEGQPAILGTLLDVTERKQADEKLKFYMASLERSNRELQDFASVASHDLQEPLRKVQAFGDRLKAKAGEALDETGRDYLDRMQNAAARMQTLVNDLLTFSRVTSRAQPFVPTDLAHIAREVLSDLETRLEQTGGRVELGDLPVIEADATQMRQLLQNLIANALKFHHPDAPPEVKITCEHDGDLVRLLVADNGIGFDEKYLDRIFTIFQRLHGREEYEGTGVGLAVCRKIVHRHNGTITARSQPGQGATFIVTLRTRQAVESRDS